MLPLWTASVSNIYRHSECMTGLEKDKHLLICLKQLRLPLMICLFELMGDWCFICQLCSVSQNNKMALMEKGGFHTHLCPRECLLHLSGVLDRSSYFESRLFLLIDKQKPGYERDVLFKRRQWSQQCLKWNSGQEEPSHTSRQKKRWQMRTCLCVCVCALSPPWQLSHNVGCITPCWHTSKPSKANRFTRISWFFVDVEMKPWL